MTTPDVVLAAILILAAPQATPSFDGPRAGAERDIGGVRFAWAPAGTFRMGSPQGERDHRPDEAQVDVTLTHGFWVGKYEVTQQQWIAMMESFPKEQDRGKGDDFPVHWVNFPLASEYCRRLTTRAHAAGTLPADWEIRLPTEAQWEYAARAGSTAATSFGESITTAQVNYNGVYRRTETNRAGASSKVGSYPPNAWGLYDMLGNEWEWCLDWYHDQLPGGVDPDFSTVKGRPNGDGSYSRVRRGCAWVEDGWTCRSAMRMRYEPDRNSDHIGFRVVAVRNKLNVL